MKTEMLLKKAEAEKLLLAHIMENDLVEIDSMEVVDGRLVINLDSVDLTVEELKDIIESNETEKSRTSLVLTPEGELGLAVESEDME